MLARTVALALLAAAAARAAEPAAPEPCKAARAALPAAAGVSAADREAVDAYRAEWRRACDPSARAVDLGALFGDAEALTADVSTSRVIEAIAVAHAASPGAAWPLPGILREGDAPLEVDWAAFEAIADRGTAEDGRFWRGAARVARRDGEPAWLGDPIPGSTAACVRLGEAPWPELVDVLEQMDRAGSEPYVRHTQGLRTRLADTFAALAKGPEACACLPGNAIGGLDAVVAAAAAERRGTPARRTIAKAASDALDALRSGRVRVRALREKPGAPPTGCGAAR